MKKYPISDHYDGKTFCNEDKADRLKNNFLNILKWKLLEKRKRWPSFINETIRTNIPVEIEPNKAAITFINHATLMLQFSKLTILTDPVFSKRVSPVSWIGPKRIRAPGLAFNELPHIDVVCVSHNHYDHLDLPSIKKLHRHHQPVFVVPLGNAALLNSVGILDVIELDWWQTVEIKGCKFTLTPAQHWSARSLRDKNKSLWGGYVFSKDNIHIFFAGDTGYSPHFKAIYQKFGAMNVSLLPIGAYQPRWFMQHHHMNPEEAVLAHLDLHSRLSIGMHFGTFALTNEGHEDPVIDLKASLVRHHLDQNNFIVLQHGETKLIKAYL